MGRPVSGQGAPLPSSALEARDAHGHWQHIWSADAAPVAWSTAPLASLVTWRAGSSNALEWGDVLLRGSGEAWRTRLIVARVRPRDVRIRLDTAFTSRRDAAWTLQRAPADALLAVNAGQFEATMPWGWVVIDGRHWLPPQHGPLSAALLQDSTGSLHWIPGDSVAQAAQERTPMWAFQSYPAVIAGDSILPPLRAAGLGIDVAHRDARVGICLTRDGRLLVAITRFDAMGSALHFIPLGLTVPEMAAALGALGCRDAMLLDGGISARLRIRDGRTGVHEWEGLRPVPLALEILPAPSRH